MTLIESIKHGEMAKAHRPWPRASVADAGWKKAIDLLVRGHCTLLGLWGDAGDVHMALLDEKAGDMAVLTYHCQDGKYPSVGAKHPPALRLERAIQSLFGLEAVGLPD